MLPFVALYACTLLVYVPGLIFAGNRQRILQHPVTAFTFLGLFIFNAVGSLFVMLPELSHRDEYFSFGYLLALNLQALVFYAVVFPYVALTPTAPMRFSCDREVDRGFLKVLLLLAAAIVGLYLVRVGCPPLIAILLGKGQNLHQILELRTRTVYGLNDFWLYNLGFTTIPLIAAIHVLAIRATSPRALPGAWLLILGCIFINALPGGKGHVLDFCTGLAIAWFLLSGWSGRAAHRGLRSRTRTNSACVREETALPNPNSCESGYIFDPAQLQQLQRSRPPFSYRRMAFYLLVTVIPVLAMYRLYLGPSVALGDIGLQLVYRIVGVYSESMAAVVAYADQHGTLGGAQLPTIRGLLDHERVNIESEIHHFMAGAPGAVPVSGPMEGYVNFGWTGFLALTLLLFGSMVAIEQSLKDAPRNVFTVSILAFYSVLATKAAQISVFATFISLTYVVLIGLLFLLRHLVASWLELGQAVPERR